MTLTELQHIFRHQTTPDKDYTPSSTLDYIVINDRGRVPVSQPVDKMEDIIASLNGFVFEGYNNRTPIFIKPEV